MQQGFCLIALKFSALHGCHFMDPFLSKVWNECVFYEKERWRTIGGFDLLSWTLGQNAS